MAVLFVLTELVVDITEQVVEITDLKHLRFKLS